MAYSGIDRKYAQIHMHFDGAEGSNKFVNSVRGLKKDQFSYTGTPTISSTTGVFGQCMKLDGASGLNMTDANRGTAGTQGLNVGTNNFTIDCRVKADAAGEGNGSLLIEKAVNASIASPWVLTMLSATYKVVYHLTKTTAWDLQLSGTAGTLTQGVWSHIKLLRNGSNVIAYKDRVACGTTNVGTNSLLYNTSNILIGHGNFSNTQFNGFMDELRFLNGTADYSFPDKPYSFDGDVYNIQVGI